MRDEHSTQHGHLDPTEAELHADGGRAERVREPIRVQGTHAIGLVVRSLDDPAKTRPGCQGNERNSLVFPLERGLRLAELTPSLPDARFVPLGLGGNGPGAGDPRT